MANSVIFSRLPLLFFTFLVCIVTDPTTSQKLAMRLIHRNSILSPHYDKSSTISNHASFSVRSSKERYAYLKAKGNGPFLPVEDTEMPVIPSERLDVMFVNISIGTPPIPQLVIMDTGSKLLWVQCEPCEECNRKVPNPIYDPRKSSSYVASSCYGFYCNYLINGKCDARQECSYFLKYVDRTSSFGTVGYENITLQTADEGAVVLPYALFGCGKMNFQPWQTIESGVMGLAAGDTSIIGQSGSSVSTINSKFSYCIGNISDPDYTDHLLILGNEAVLDGPSTKIEIRRGQYFLSLEGISLGQTEIKIDPEDYESNMLIDSGTTLNYLFPDTFELLKAEVKWLVKNISGYPIEIEPDMLCFKGNYRRDLKDFPVGKFHLSGGVKIVLDIEGLFKDLGDDKYCLAFSPSTGDKSILGLHSQQYYNIGFDVLNKKVYFQNIDCRFVDYR